MDAPVLLPSPTVHTLDDHLARGGGRGLERARRLGPVGTIDEVERSGLRGRGGAGFPTGRKWRSVRGGGPGDGSGDRFVVCNAAEGEPGTFKDRAILRADPYQVVEGTVIAALAVEAREAFIALKRSFTTETERLRQALVEMADAGLVGDVPITLVVGPEEYLFGEETGLLQVVEGEAPLPRTLPPYLHGLYATTPNTGWSARAGLAQEQAAGMAYGAANPTLVNNAESLATVSHVLARGAEWHRSLGTPDSPGFTVCTVSGDTRRDGVAEVELGTPLRQVIDRVGGGIRQGRACKAVLSGVANPVLLPEHLDAPLSYEGLEAIGSGLGSAGFVVYDDTTSAVELAHTATRFLFVESCGQCPPCKLGTGDITVLLEDLLRGEGGGGEALERIAARLRTVADGNRCYLPVQAQRLVASLLRSFPDEFTRAAAGLRPPTRGLLVPKLIDLTDGRAVLDERQAAKRPDWTYG